MRPVPSAPAVPVSSRPLLRLACLLALSSVPVLLQAAPAALEREVNTFIGSKDDGNTNSHLALAHRHYKKITLN